MQRESLCRTERLFGTEAMERLAACRVAVFGIGGVGGYAVEALARSGIGALDLIDSDTVALSNINRQILATHATVGLDKVAVAAARIRDINPACVVRTHKIFYLPETADQFDLRDYDYIVDAVDTVTAKIALAANAWKDGVPIISSMGTGNKTDPTRFRATDLWKTDTDPLARVLRRKLRECGVRRLRVVWSDEPPVHPAGDVGAPETENGRHPPASNAFVPPVAGMILAGEVVRALIARGKDPSHPIP